MLCPDVQCLPLHRYLCHHSELAFDLNSGKAMPALRLAMTEGCMDHGVIMYYALVYAQSC